MTTGLVVSVTDELVAELEQYSGVPAIAALLAEHAELKRDAERYRWLQKASPYMHKKIRELAITDGGDVFYFHKDKYDVAIDAAMQSEAKP